jgi:hypothetical protein
VASPGKMPAVNYGKLIRTHQSALDATASKATRSWWETNVKGVIPFRGSGIPTIRELLAAWRGRNGIETWALERQFDLALAFFDERAPGRFDSAIPGC